jgi:hypothetical protein
MVSFLLSSGMPSTNPVCTFLTLYTLRSVPFRFVHFHCLGKNNHDNKRAYASTMDCFTHIRALLVLQAPRHWPYLASVANGQSWLVTQAG